MQACVCDYVYYLCVCPVRVRVRTCVRLSAHSIKRFTSHAQLLQRHVYTPIIMGLFLIDTG